MNREEKVKFIAEAFMLEDPEEYAGETLDEVMAQIRQTDDPFIDFTYNAYASTPDTSTPKDTI